MTSGVRVGQVWADLHPRREGRTVRVDRLDALMAHCAVVTAVGGGSARSGKHTQVMYDSGTLLGYQLVSEGDRP